MHEPAPPIPARLTLAAALVLGLVCGASGARARDDAPPPRRPNLPGLLAPPGYFIDSVDAVSKRPTWEEGGDGAFTYSVRRVFSDSTEARLLGIAEAVYPARDDLITIAARNYYDTGRDTAHVPLWWCKGIGANRIPYAVTAGTMEHFLALTKRFRDHDFWESGMGGGLWRSDFVYDARIAPDDSFTMGNREFKDVYVVQISFGWSFDDGTFVPSTEASRTVVLDRRGDVLAIQGDGTADEDVHLSGHRGIGRTEHIFR